MQIRSSFGFFLSPSNFKVVLVILNCFLYCQCMLTYPEISSDRNQLSKKQRQLRILPDQKKVSLEAFKTLVLTCQGENQDPGYFSNFQWLNKNGELIESNRKYLLTKGEGTLSLIIEDPTVNDRGVYTCVALFQNTVTLNATIELDIYKGITWDECELEQFLKYGALGQKIVCRISSFPTSKINWEKDEKPLDMNLYAISNDGIIIRGKVDNVNAGSFKVKASMVDYGILRTRLITVRVISPPRIVQLDALKVAVAGDKVTIDCKAFGSTPLYSFIDNRRRNLSLEAGFNVDHINGILIIDSVQKESEDQYIECLVENNGGRDSKRIQLQILTKPVVFEFKNESFYEQMSALWVCRVRGYPLPSVEIVKIDHSSSLDKLDEKVVQSSASRFSYKITKVSNEEVDYKLIINRVSRGDDGLYLCKANNSAGLSAVVGHIQVQYPPDLTDTSTEIRTWGNKPVNLSCMANAVPNATFLWYKNGQQVEIDDQVYSVLEYVGQSHLQVYPNRGRYVYSTYSCRASNPLGERSIDITLKEAYPPSSPTVKILRTQATSIDVEVVDVTSDLPVKHFLVKYWQDFVGSAPYEVIWPAVGRIYKLTGLTPRTRYQISFAAENDVGVSPHTPPIHHDTPAESRPEKAAFFFEETQERGLIKDGFVQSEFGDQFKFRWHQAEDNGRAIQYYLIKVHKVLKTLDSFIVAHEKDQLEPIKVLASTSPEHLLLDLVPNTFYKIQLIAVNSIGEGDPVDLVFRTSHVRSIGKQRPPRTSTVQHIFSTHLIPITISLVFILIAMDLIFYIRCKVGFLHLLVNLCRSSNSVSSKTVNLTR